MRFLVALALIVGVVGATILADDTAGPSAPAPAATATTARAATIHRRIAMCPVSALRVSSGGGPVVGLSQLRTGLELRNAGQRVCWLGGSVRVAWATGPHGRQIGSAARPIRGEGRVHRLTLRPGARVSATLDIVLGDGGLPASECRPEPVTGLRIAPVSARGTLFVRTGNGDPAGACSMVTPTPQLRVGPLRAGVVR
jgi:hypothetical protein